MKTKPRVSQKNLFSVPDGKYYLGDNLLLRVRGSSRSFFFRFYKNNRSHELSIGPAKFLTIADARNKVIELKSRIFQGENVLVEKKGSELVLFEDVYEEAIKGIERTKKWTNEKHAAQWISTVKTYAVPVIGRYAVNDITRDDIFRVLSPIWETKTETASRVRGRLENIFEFLKVKGLYKHDNPAMWKNGLSVLLPPAKKIANEFQKAKWSEIDFETKTWIHNRRKDKKKYPHRVPLSDQCISLLKSLPRNRGEFIFASAHGSPLALDTFRMVLQKNVKRKVTMHGCRSTFRDWCAENGVDPVLSEKSLMHKTGNEVEEAYQRSDLLEQRRPLMQDWADALLSD